VTYRSAPATGFTFNLSRKEGTRVVRWADNNPLDLKWEEIGEHYG
jgi:hypothetical protein